MESTFVTRFLFISAVILGSLISPSMAQNVYEIPEGEDGHVFFHHDIPSQEAIYSYDLFSPDRNCVFCKKGIVDTSCLDPDLRDRVVVHYIRNKTTVVVSLMIQKISRADKGFYILAMRESVSENVTNLLQVAYIDAIFPPGEVRCKLQSSSYTDEWQQLHCKATVGSDGKGNLTCFQNDSECVFLTPVWYSDSHVSATFWVDKEHPVRCCSFPTATSITHQSCSQFSYPQGTTKSGYE